MPYLYPVLGVTAWIAVVTLSTQALINNENTKQLDKITSYIEVAGHKLVDSIPNQEVLYVPSTNTQEQVIAPVVTPKQEVITEPKVSPVRTNNREEDDEEDEDD
jgi:hypothetical protein